MRSIFTALVIIVITGCAMTTSTPSASTNITNTTTTVDTTITATTTTTDTMISDPVYQGTVLAGTTAPFLEFNQADYEAAVAADQLIILDFYATWCPICIAEQPQLLSGFNQLTGNQVVGFRVNYNDDDTDSDEEALAKQFGITYQHTKVVVQNGKVITTTLDVWDADDVVTAAQNAL